MLILSCFSNKNNNYDRTVVDNTISIPPNNHKSAMPTLTPALKCNTPNEISNSPKVFSITRKVFSISPKVILMVSWAKEMKYP